MQDTQKRNDESEDHAGGCLAVDIVLLPPDRFTEEVIAMNSKLTAVSGDRSIILGRERSVPHISLAMACIRTSDMPLLCERINDLVSSELPVELEAEGIATVTTSSGDRVSGIDFRKTGSLVRLHESVMDILSGYSCGLVSPDMVKAGPEEPVSDFTLQYISKFAENSAYGRFSPHITLGHGEAGSIADLWDFPARFDCSKIAVCHLGNGCTCEEILWVRA